MLKHPKFVNSYVVIKCFITSVADMKFRHLHIFPSMTPASNHCFPGVWFWDHDRQKVTQPNIKEIYKLLDYKYVGETNIPVETWKDKFTESCWGFVNENIGSFLAKRAVDKVGTLEDYDTKTEYQTKCRETSASLEQSIMDYSKIFNCIEGLFVCVLIYSS